MRFFSWLRTNGWVLNLVFIALASYFFAGAANAVVARGIRVVPAVDDRARVATGQPALAPPRQELTSIAARNLLGIKRENLVPESEVQEDATANPDDIRACTLQVGVRATLVAEGAPEWSMAVLFINNEAGVYSINEGKNQVAADATLVDIEQRSVVVRRRDHFERCFADVEGGPAGTLPVTPVAAQETSPGKAEASGVTKLGDTQYAIERTEVNHALNNLSEVATQARLVPSFKNGKANGFKVFSIKAGSIYSKIGLQNGDVINKINGYEMNSPDVALDIYQKLKDASSVSIEVNRRGQTMTMNYDIRG